MKILIQKIHLELKKDKCLLNDAELERVKWAHEQTKASNEIENIYFTKEEEELFRLFEKARLPLSIQPNLINIYLEKVLA